MNRPPAVFSVLQNADLIMTIASFLVESSSNNDALVLSSPMLPLVLSFRPLHTRMMLKLRYSNEHLPRPRLISNKSDFVDSVEMIMWAKSMGCSFGPNDEKLCAFAARCGALNVIQWARAQNPPCPWDERTCAWAAQNGHLHVLEWARAQDPPCPWCEDTCTWAAQNGHLHVLEWARAQDPPCPWYERTCAWAARNGHLHVLEWARAQDPPCPWDERTCAVAAQSGH
jgi:hypothetical protein